MSKYRRVLCRYLCDPFHFRDERYTLNRSADKLEDLILNQEINAMMNKAMIVSDVWKKDLTVVLHQIHKCFEVLSKNGLI